MATVGEDLLKLNIKESSFSPVFLFYGDEDYMKKYYLQKIKQKAVGDNLPEFNLHEIDGTRASVDELIEQAMLVPMMSDYALIIIHDFDFSNVSEEKIEELSASLCSGTIMLFYYQSVKPNAQRSAWKKVIKLFKEKGSVIKFEKKDSRELTKIVMSASKKRGCLIPQYLAARFVERVGDDLNLLLNEVNKLCALKGEGEITQEDIEAVTVKTLDASAFDLTKALIDGNPDTAFLLLHELIDQKQEAVMIMGAVNSAYIDMYRVKTASEKGLDALAVANFYPYKAEWRLKKAAFNAKKLSLSQLRRSIHVLCEADTMLKSVQNDSTVVLDEVIVKLLLIAARG